MQCSGIHRKALRKDGGVVCEEIKSEGKGKFVQNGKVPLGTREKVWELGEQWVRGEDTTKNSMEMS